MIWQRHCDRPPSRFGAAVIGKRLASTSVGITSQPASDHWHLPETLRKSKFISSIPNLVTKAIVEHFCDRTSPQAHETTTRSHAEPEKLGSLDQGDCSVSLLVLRTPFARGDGVFFPYPLLAEYDVQAARRLILEQNRGIAVSVGGPALTYWVVPTEEELRSRYNPDLLKKSIEGRAEREAEFNDFVTKLKQYSKSDKPSTSKS